MRTLPFTFCDRLAGVDGAPRGLEFAAEDGDQIRGDLCDGAGDGGSEAGGLDIAAAGAGRDVEEHGAFFQREGAGGGIEGEDGVLADADDGVIRELEFRAGFILREEIGLGLDYVVDRGGALIAAGVGAEGDMVLDARDGGRGEGLGSLGPGPGKGVKGEG